MQLKSKEKIKKLHAAIERIKDKIEEEANAAMEAEGIKIPYYDIFTDTYVSDLYDKAQWFNISTEWDCIASPFGYCMYHKIHDPAMDYCVFCGQPKERK